MSTFLPDPDESRPARQGLVAVGFLLLSLVTLQLPDSQQQWIAETLRSTVLRPFVATQESLVRLRLRAGEIAELRREVDSLVARMTNRSNLVEENRRLRALLELGRRVGPAYRGASVLRPGTEGSASVFLLDVGRSDGVREGAPVLVKEGLVGVVREVQGERSVAMDWTHPDFRASAMTEDGEIYGIVEPRRGDFREVDRLVLTGAPFHATLAEGARIVTSGRGGVYPRGIAIGSVDGLAEEEGGWRKTYWIRPAVAAGSVTHVLVAVRSEQARPDDLQEAMLGAESGEGEGTETP